MVGIISVVLRSIAVAQVLANAGESRQPAVAVAAWLAVLASAAWLVPRVRAGGLTAGETAAGIAIAIAAVPAVEMAQQSHGGQLSIAHGGPGAVDLGILGTVWLLIMVVLSRPARVWVPAALLVLVVHGAFLLRDQGVSPTSLSQLMASGYIMAAVLIAFAPLRP